MPGAALKMCNKPGCSALVPRGYCDAHKRPERSDGFARLNERKTPEQKRFYSGRRWTETSARHRRSEPLCRRCKAAGRVVTGELVHHNPPLTQLLAEGRNPYSDIYLETLCNRCHLVELRAMKVTRQ